MIYYSRIADEVYEYLKDYNRTKKRTALIVFDDIIAGMKANKKLKAIVAFHESQKAQHFSCFYITILFCSA